MHISNKCSIAIHCLVYIHEFSSNHKITSERLALSTGSNPVTVRSILSALKKAGIIVTHAGVGGTAIRCPAEEVTLYRICCAVEPKAIFKLMGIHKTATPFDPVSKNIRAVLAGPYGILQNDVAESMKRITLQQFIDAYRAQTADT